jgi:hypothetical protein
LYALVQFLSSSSHLPEDKYPHDANVINSRIEKVKNLIFILWLVLLLTARRFN